MKEGKRALNCRQSIFYLALPVSYWLMNMFASPAMLEQIRSSLKLQPDIIRFTILKKADTLKHLIRP